MTPGFWKHLSENAATGGVVTTETQLDCAP